MRQTRSLHLQAALDLLRRYGEIFRHAWKVRHSLDPVQRRQHEIEFLPAALALQDTPLSPAPKIAMRLIVAFALIALLWAMFGDVDVVATARGKIVPNDRTKVIQPFEPATVTAIHVTDGQSVKAGDILVELDTTSTTADTTRTANDLVTAKLQAARAKAMLGAIASGRTPVLGKVPEAEKDRMEGEKHLLEGQFGEYQAKLFRIDADIAKREAELRSTQEIVRKLEQTVPIARQRARDYHELVGKNFMSKHGYLEKEQARIEQEADLATQRSRLSELAAAVQEGHGQRRSLVAETRRLALDTMNESEQKARAYSQELVKAETRNRLKTLTAPVDGTIQQLAIHTVGGVVTEAQQLMVLVPKDFPVEVEAYVENKDIGFVSRGQTAVVKIETFPFTKYGTIDAKVSHVSDDAMKDEKMGLVFPIRVKLDKASIRVENKSVNLSPGMAVTVEVKTAQRRIIEYFLSPLLQYRDESLRER